MKKVYIYSLILLAIDILVKLTVVNLMVVNDKITIIKSFFSIWYVKNNGAAFGILQNNQFLLTLIAGAVLIVLLNMLKHEKKKMPTLSIIVYSMLIAGVAGNMIDRLFYNHVIDYFSFQIGPFTMPIFNIADSYIFISLMIYLIMSYRGKEVFRK